MIQIKCTCRVCKANAAALGLPVLRAEVPDALATVVKLKGAAHSFVYDAHSPSAVSAAIRARTGIRPL